MKKRTKIGLLFVILALSALLYIDFTTNMISERWNMLFKEEEPIIHTSMQEWQKPTDSPIVKLKPTNAMMITLPMQEFVRHHVVLFLYPTATKTVRFFVIKEGLREQTQYRAVADACELCFTKKQGFDYAEKYFICRDCSMKFHSERVGIASGGCNPILIPIIYTEGRLEISKEDLAKIAQMF